MRPLQSRRRGIEDQVLAHSGTGSSINGLNLVLGQSALEKRQLINLAGEETRDIDAVGGNIGDVSYASSASIDIIARYLLA